MAGTISPEDSIAALKTVISTNISAQITALDARYGDFSLPTTITYHLAPVARHVNIPALVLVPIRSRKLHEEGAEDIYAHTIGGELIMRSNVKSGTDNIRERVTRVLMRLAEGIEQILEDDQWLTVSSVRQVDQVLMEEVNYSEQFAPDENVLEQRAVLRCTPSDATRCTLDVIECTRGWHRSVPSAPHVWNAGTG